MVLPFVRKTWVDNAAGATPITAAELNRIEQGIVDLETESRPIRAVTAWPTTDLVLGDEAIISSTGEHRVWKGTTLGWRLASDHSVATTADLPAISTCYEGMEVYVQNLNVSYRCWDMGSGVLTWKSCNPFCRVRLGADQAYTGGDIVISTWNTAAEDDTDAIWDKTNNRMVVPVTGIYRVHLHTTLSGATTGVAVARLSTSAAHTTSIATGQVPLINTENHIDAFTELGLVAGSFLYSIYWSNNTAGRPIIQTFGTPTSWTLEYVRPEM